MRPALAALLALVVVSSFAGPRSAAAKAEFKRSHPCPPTGARRGVCHGYVIDHIKPLACGGADRPDNMQWQTIAEGKAKDRWERRECGK